MWLNNFKLSRNQKHQIKRFKKISNWCFRFLYHWFIDFGDRLFKTKWSQYDAHILQRLLINVFSTIECLDLQLNIILSVELTYQYLPFPPLPWNKDLEGKRQYLWKIYICKKNCCHVLPGALPLLNCLVYLVNSHPGVATSQSAVWNSRLV